MSGIVDNSATIAAIRGNFPAVQLQNPLDTASKYQSLKNAQTENELQQQQLQNAQLANKKGTFELNNANSNRGAQVLYSMTNMSDDELKGGKVLHGALQDAVKQGMDPNTAAVIGQRIDEITQKGGDANGHLYRPLLGRLFATTLAGPDALKALGNTTSVTDSGGQLVPTATSGPLAQNPSQTTFGNQAPGQALTKTLPPGYQDTGDGLTPVGGALGSPPLTKGLSPQDMTREITATDLDPKSPTYMQQKPMTVGAWLEQQNATKLLKPGGPTNNLQPATSAPTGNNLGSGQTGVRDTSGNVVSPANPPRLKPASGYGTPIPTTLSKTAEKGADDSVAAFSSAQNTHNNFATRDATYDNIRRDITNAKTGAGTDFVQHIQSLIKTQSPELLKQMGIDPEKITDIESAKKGLALLLSQNSGGQTDAGRANSQTATGSIEMDNDALKRLLNFNQGTDRMKEAAYQNFVTNEGGSSTKGAAWNDSYGRFASKLDPRGFMLRQMMTEDPKGTTEMVNKMTPAQRQKLHDARVISDQMAQGQ